MNPPNRRPPGIIIRAMVSEARTQAGVAATWARRAGDILGELPKVVADAARVLEDIARQQASGVSHPHTVEAVEGARHTIKEQLAEAQQILEVEMGALGGYKDDVNQGAVDVESRGARFDAAYARRKRASWFQSLLNRKLSPESELGPPPGPTPPTGPTPPPGPTPGPTPTPGPAPGPTPGPTRRRRARPSRLRRIGQAAGMMFAGQMLALPIQGLAEYEDYETTLTRLLARRGVDDMDLNAFVEDPELGYGFLRRAQEADIDGRKKGDSASVRREGAAKVDEWRTLFPTYSDRLLLTGKDAISAMLGLGYHLNRRRAVSAGRFGRQFALDTGRAATFYHTFLKATGPDQPRVSKQARLAATATQSPKTVAGGALDLVTTGMIDAGMRSRPEEYIEDLEADLGALQQGVFFVKPETAVGFRSFMARAGMSGEARRGVGSELISGAGDTGDEAMLPAKMSAVRQFVPGAKGMSVRKLIELVESGDPAVIGAFIKYAEMKARETGGIDGAADEGYAKDIFSRMTSTSRWKSGAVWDQAKKEAGIVGRPPKKGKGGDVDLWQRGPMVSGEGEVTAGSRSPISAPGPHTFGARSIARHKAELSLAKYQFGRMLVPFANNLKEAAIVGVGGLMEGNGISSLNEAVDTLYNRSAYLLMAIGLASGTPEGKAVAGLIIQRKVTDMLRGADPAAELRSYQLRPDIVPEGLTMTQAAEVGAAYGATAGETAAVMAIASESSGGGLFGPEGTGIAYTIANRMRQSGRGAWREAVGESLTTGPQAGRPYSTKRVPGAARFPRILEMFRGAVGAPDADPTGGAVEFFHPVTQEYLHGKHPTRFRSPEEVHKLRLGRGLTRVPVAGAENTAFYR